LTEFMLLLGVDAVTIYLILFPFYLLCVCVC